MAEKEALKKLEDQLNCPICLDTYTDPKQLNCHHVYCQQCLTKLVVQDQQGELVLTCPNCRQITPVPASGVAGLQAAFQINQLLEIVEEHKKAKDATASVERVEITTTSPTPLRSVNTVGCPQHDGRKVIFYCNTCGETICYKCTKKGEKHIGHDYEELDEAFEKYVVDIMSSLEPMEKQLVTIKRALAQLDVRCEEISNHQATMEANIHRTIDRLHQTLDVRKTELIGQLHQLTQVKLKNLAAQRDQIETTQAQLSSCLHFMRENLKTADRREALMMKSTTAKQVKELTTTFQPDMLEPNTEADLIFSALTDIIAVIQNYGQVYEPGPPDSSKCTATGKGVEVAAVGEKSTALLQTLSFDNQPSKETLNSIMCELVSELTGTRVGGSVERRGQSQYQISYQPTIKGWHKLHIKVEGHQISGSPFPVAARSPVEKLGTPILTISGVEGPWGVAVNQRGKVVVTEGDGNRVSVFSPSGKRLRSFGTQGAGLGEFINPYGVIVDSMGCIIVTDAGNQCIQKFTAKGKFLAAVRTTGSWPRGIAYNTSNDKYYVADGTGSILILNSDLSYVGKFGEEGRGKGELSDPRHLACDSSGNVYVADYYNHRIQVFIAKGEFLKIFERYGEGVEELRGPCGVTIDSNDRVYISDFNKYPVTVFTTEGQFVTSFGRERSESEPRRFNCPAGLAVDSNGVVYVCDFLNYSLDIF